MWFDFLPPHVLTAHLSFSNESTMKAAILLQKLRTRRGEEEDAEEEVHLGEDTSVEIKPGPPLCIS